MCRAEPLKKTICEAPIKSDTVTLVRQWQTKRKKVSREEPVNLYSRALTNATEPPRKSGHMCHGFRCHTTPYYTY